MRSMKTTIKMTKVIVSAIALVFICAGCLLSDLDKGHFETRYESGLRAAEAGDYSSASQLFYAAYQRSDVYGVPPQAKASCAYNLAICTGQLGKFEQAESWFKGAMTLEDKIEGKDGPHASSDWFELARLYQAWGKYDASIEAYEKAFPLEAKYGYDKIDPAVDAIIWDDYASVLKKAGLDAKAKSAEIQAQKIRDENPGQTASPKFHYYPTK
jgi:tetratricopeptide (TPR) repeat protein